MGEKKFTNKSTTSVRYNINIITFYVLSFNPYLCCKQIVRSEMCNVTFSPGNITLKGVLYGILFFSRISFKSPSKIYEESVIVKKNLLNFIGSFEYK